MWQCCLHSKVSSMVLFTQQVKIERMHTLAPTWHSNLIREADWKETLCPKYGNLAHTHKNTQCSTATHLFKAEQSIFYGQYLSVTKKTEVFWRVLETFPPAGTQFNEHPQRIIIHIAGVPLYKWGVNTLILFLLFTGKRQYLLKVTA